VYAVLQHNAANETQAASAFPVSAAMSNYCTTARQGAKNDRDYGARHPVLRHSIVLHHGCVLAYGPTRASSPTSEMPRSVAGILTEKVGVTWHHVPWVRTGSYRPRIRAGLRRLFKDALSARSPAGVSDSRALRCRRVVHSLRNRRYPQYALAQRRHLPLLRATELQTIVLLLARSESHFRSIHACGAIHSLRPRNRWSCGPFRCT